MDMSLKETIKESLIISIWNLIIFLGVPFCIFVLLGGSGATGIMWVLLNIIFPLYSLLSGASMARKTSRWAWLYPPFLALCFAPAVWLLYSPAMAVYIPIQAAAGYLGIGLIRLFAKLKKS